MVVDGVISTLDRFDLATVVDHVQLMDDEREVLSSCSSRSHRQCEQVQGQEHDVHWERVSTRIPSGKDHVDNNHWHRYAMPWPLDCRYIARSNDESHEVHGRERVRRSILSVEMEVDSKMSGRTTTTTTTKGVCRVADVNLETRAKIYERKQWIL